MWGEELDLHMVFADLWACVCDSASSIFLVFV